MYSFSYVEKEFDSYEDALDFLRDNNIEAEIQTSEYGYKVAYRLRTNVAEAKAKKSFSYGTLMRANAEGKYYIIAYRYDAGSKHKYIYYKNKDYAQDMCNKFHSDNVRVLEVIIDKKFFK